MDNFQKNLDVLEFSDSYFSNSVKILLVCQVLKVSTALNPILILPVYFLFYKTLYESTVQISVAYSEKTFNM